MVCHQMKLKLSKVIITVTLKLIIWNTLISTDLNGKVPEGDSIKTSQLKTQNKTEKMSQNKKSLKVSSSNNLNENKSKSAFKEKNNMKHATSGNQKNHQPVS